MRLLPALLLFLSAVPAPAASPSEPEMRGLWVVRTALVSPQAVDRVVDEAREAGFNTLFVQVRGRGDAFYDSHLVSRSSLLWQQPGDFDPLARLLERARAAGLTVHAWLNVLLTAHFSQPLPAGHVLRLHPDWLMVPRAAAAGSLAAPPSALPRIVAQAARGDGDVEGYYLSPSAPGVGEHLEAVVRELLRGYPVQGLHLDFIRYPGPDYDYSRPALEGFRRTHGGSGLVGGPAQDPAAWDAYRRDTLTALLVRIGKAAREEQPGIVVSAAVVPDEAQAVSHRYQHWPSWMARGLLDALCPMTYTPDSRIFRQQLEQVLTHVVGSRPAVWAGIGAYRLPLEGILEKVRIARESGVSGVLLFSHESLLPSDRMRLRHEAFPAPDAPGLPGTGARALSGRSPR
jgi:uncharacterized lipoprotein YddW (UPF0748 family)